MDNKDNTAATKRIKSPKFPPPYRDWEYLKSLFEKLEEDIDQYEAKKASKEQSKVIEEMTPPHNLTGGISFSDSVSKIVLDSPGDTTFTGALSTTAIDRDGEDITMMRYYDRTTTAQRKAHAEQASKEKSNIIDPAAANPISGDATEALGVAVDHVSTEG